ncbi:MAG: ATP-dependent helicase RecG, partial [Frankiales bacterium]|nr:ATP-dependent helicase RecG [Frankiales bacterium]
MDHSLYLADLATVTTAQVRQFLSDLIHEQLLTENLTVELKARRSGYNVAEAVCALANTEGGLVLVGVDESAAPAMDGVPPPERDAIVRQLTATLEPAYLPEITTVVSDDPSRAVIVIRVNPDDVPAPPILCRGRAYLRQPGQTSRARLDQLLGLVRRGAAGQAVYAPGATAVGSM